MNTYYLPWDVRPATLPDPLPIQPHTPISDSTLDMRPGYKQGQARRAHTRPSNLTRFATGISAHSFVQVNSYPQENTELSQFLRSLTGVPSVNA